MTLGLSGTSSGVDPVDREAGLVAVVRLDRHRAQIPLRHSTILPSPAPNPPLVDFEPKAGDNDDRLTHYLSDICDQTPKVEDMTPLHPDPYPRCSSR